MAACKQYFRKSRSALGAAYALGITPPSTAKAHLKLPHAMNIDRTLGNMRRRHP